MRFRLLILLLCLAVLITPTMAQAQGQVAIARIWPATITATLDATDEGVVLDLKGYPAVGIELAGTFDGTVTFEGSIFGVSYYPISLTNTSGTTATTATVPGLYSGSVIGYAYVRARASTYSSGAISVKANGTLGGGSSGSTTLEGDIVVTDVGITSISAGDTNIGNVDVASSALPTGAATSAKQPALGTAGSSSTDVISVQGIASGTALPVSIASVPSHAVTNAGTFAVQAAQSGTWNIGSITTLPAIPTGSNVIGAVTQSGTWTVQPGNTANTTPWLTTIAQGGNSAVVNGSGQLSITCANCSGSGASAVDESAFTTGTTSGAPAMGLFQTSPSSVTNGEVGALGMTANRQLKTTLFTSAGVEATFGTDYTQDAALTVGTTAGPMSMFRGSAAAPSAASADNDAVMGWSNLVGAQAMFLTGTSNAILPGTATDGLLVNLGTNNDVTTVEGAGALLTAVQLIDDAQTGDSVHYRTSAGSTEDEHEVKATAGRLFSVAFSNTNAAARYWRCANLTAANTTPGSSTVLFGLAVPGATAGAGFTHTFGPNGVAFSTALTCWFTTGAADSDVAEVAANEIKAIYTYK